MVEDIVSNDHSDKPTRDSEYGLMLPCQPEQFGEFVSALLGKPQTIEKAIPGAFEIDNQAIVNTYQLVEQRIKQQNDAVLVQFTVRIVYDDNSSVLLNSFTDFQHYNEIRPIASTGVVLTWIYLIQFKNKKVPEKQEINITFIDDHGNSVVFSEGVVLKSINRWRMTTPILLSIRHTERTWGVDMESLLTGHLKTLIKDVPITKKFINKHSDKLGLSVGFGFFLASLSGVYYTSSNFINSYVQKIQTLSLGAGNSSSITS